VAALSGPVDPGRLAAGLDALRALGYEPVLASNLASRAGIFAGDDRERLDAFHRLAADDTVRAVVFARGGHGVLRLLPRLDWRLLARHPRAYVGYSDLTPFLHQVVARLGVVAFHGPMAAAELADGLRPGELESFERALRGEVAAEIPLRIVAPGHRGGGEGPLLGGCLSLLTGVQGTSFAPDLEGSVLFLEDVAEPLYRLDRMLTHLRLSGNLSDLQGLIVGHLSGDENGDRDAGSTERAFQGYLEELAERYGWPVARGLPAGHARPNLTLPLGVRARLDGAVGTLKISAAAARR
jgi:muramoyltetrapeptide carboxypeptidase